MPCSRGAQRELDQKVQCVFGRKLPGLPLYYQLAFKDRADPSPGSDPTLTGILPKGCLQQEYWDPTSKEEYEVWDEEGTCGEREQGEKLKQIHY